MRKLLTVCVVILVILAACSGNDTPRQAPPVAIALPTERGDDGSAAETVEEPRISEAELSRTERTFEYDPNAIAIPVSVAAPPPQAYRNPRYLRQCRRDSRRGDLPESERVEVKSEARTRARQLARDGQLDEALIFTRMAYGEEGTPTEDNADGYHAMLAVIDFQRGGMSRVEMMVNYAPRRVFPQTGDSRAATRQRWIAELQLNGRRPPSWPAHRSARWHSYPPWQSYGCPRWLATADAVRPLLRRYEGRPVGRGPCEEVPHHWGGDMDDHSDDCHWRVIDCGRTADTFWVIDEVCREQSLPGQSEVLQVAADDDHATNEPPGA